MGIPLLTIAGYAIQALDLVPQIIAAGQDIQGYVTKTTGVIKAAQDAKTDIPDSAWDELSVIREGLQGRLHAP